MKLLHDGESYGVKNQEGVSLPCLPSRMVLTYLRVLMGNQHLERVNQISLLTWKQSDYSGKKLSSGAVVPEDEWDVERGVISGRSRE